MHVKNFKCKSRQAVVQENSAKKVNLNEHTLEVMKKFINLGNVLNTGGKAHDAVVFRIRGKSNKFKEMSGILCGRSYLKKYKV